MGQRLIITEEERDSIRRLHKSNIFEAPESQQPAQTQQLTKIQQLQTKLNEKFNSGLIVDGKWGPKTASAVVNALKPKTPQQPAQKEQPLPTLPAGTVQRTNQSTQLSNQTPTQGTPKVGMSAVGYLQDEAQGYKFIVQKVTPITECGITELELVTKQGGRPRYGYYKDNDMESIKRFGERVKSNNPCADFASMDSFGALKFS
jgi:peptidoglycan hydrolase-like protein with peptidoglycan-binding domain